MSIQSINNYSSSDYQRNLLLTKTMEKLSSGSRINSAADDAAGLAISEKLLSQANGYDRGTQNALDGQSMINTAEGGLSGMNDSLQRMRELAVQASNGIYTDSDRAMIQEEIEQLKSTITDLAKGTEFNTKKLLDGSISDVNLATNPQGTGMNMKLVSSTLEDLGIADFDVTKNFSIDSIDKALDKVNSARSNLGATSNRLDHTINNNLVASENLTASQSRIADADYAKEVSQFQTQKVLNQYSMFAQKQRMAAQSGLLALFN